MHRRTCGFSTCTGWLSFTVKNAQLLAFRLHGFHFTACSCSNWSATSSFISTNGTGTSGAEDSFRRLLVGVSCAVKPTSREWLWGGGANAAKVITQNCGISYLCSKLCLSHIYEITEKLPLLVLHMHTLNCTTFLYTKLSLHIQTHYTNKGQQQLMHKEKRTQEESRAVLDKTAMLPDCCSKRKEAVMSTK